jgi:hypothetical protein
VYERDYELKVAPAPAMSEKEYHSLARSELRALLEANEVDEAKYQALLERFPILVPGIDPLLPVGHNGLFPRGVITQPQLAGLGAKIPDFGIFSYTSSTLYITLVEIESPAKKWATRTGQSTRQLTQAIQQLRDWSIWFSDPINEQQFLRDYRVPTYLLDGRDFAQHYVLIYGRRSELETSRFGKPRNRLSQANETFMSWYRVAPQDYPSDIFTLRLYAEGYRAVTVPPMMTVGPHSAQAHAMVHGREDAVDRATEIPEVRRDFLKARWPYWDSYAARQDAGLGFTLETALDAE